MDIVLGLYSFIYYYLFVFGKVFLFYMCVFYVGVVIRLYLGKKKIELFVNLVVMVLISLIVEIVVNFFYVLVISSC